MNSLNDQRVKPLCELKHAAINIIHHTKNAGQDAFTTGVSEKSQGEYKGQGQAKAEYQGVKYL